MRHCHHRTKQTGVVLVLGLLLLLIITVVAVASMGNTFMQERMAGNAQTQALAFQVASAGITSALDVYRDHGAGLKCADKPSDWINKSVEVKTEPKTIGSHKAHLTQLLYCIEPETEEGVRPQYYVLSIGEIGPPGSPVARRAIEVKVRDALGDEDCGALCFLGCDKDNNSYQFPTSNAFKVDGEDNAAITAPADCKEDVRAAIRDNRIGNYEGGISGYANPLPSPWTNPAALDNFRKELLDRMGAKESSGSETEPHDFLIDEGTPDTRDGVITGSDFRFEFINEQSFVENGNREFGTPRDEGDPNSGPQITYIAGDAAMGGNVSGAGILVVEGNLEWNGTPPFEGLILVLGGRFAVKGGGTGGAFKGSLVVANLWKEWHGYDKFGGIPAVLHGDGKEFGPVDIDFTGGGTANYTYHCETLQNYSTDLGLKKDTGGNRLWDPACGTEDGTGQAVLEIVSWRESLGWRGGF